MLRALYIFDTDDCFWVQHFHRDYRWLTIFKRFFLQWGYWIRFWTGEICNISRGKSQSACQESKKKVWIVNTNKYAVFRQPAGRRCKKFCILEILAAFVSLALKPGWYIWVESFNRLFNFQWGCYIRFRTVEIWHFQG
jgi:hypothetical protein